MKIDYEYIIGFCVLLVYTVGMIVAHVPLYVGIVIGPTTIIISAIILFKLYDKNKEN